MELLLKRIIKTAESTIGELSVNGVFECYVLEDFDRGLSKEMPLSQIISKKQKGSTCIPTGQYEISISFSNKFKKKLPAIDHVPGFAGIRIHPGNTAADTIGCLLPGTAKSDNKVINSKVAFAALFYKINKTMDKEKIFITIA